VVPNDGDAGRAAAQGTVHEHVAARSLCSVLVSVRLEYAGTWQPAWDNREQDLGDPLASSGAGWKRTGGRCWTCPIDASTQTFVLSYMLDVGYIIIVLVTFIRKLPIG
jgi:hypothetical protein